jgi:hypothetical protein
MLLSLVAVSLLADIAPPPPPVAPKRPPPPPAACRADTDCRLSTFAGCCPGCCTPPPHAVPVGTKEGEFCAAVDCAPPNCEAVKCARADALDWVAACVGGRCVAQRRQAECRVDADCRVVETMPAGCSGACGCCPTTQAVPADAVVPLQRRPTPRPSPEKKQGEPPNFGLSTGSPAGPPPPQCSPCPAPVPGRAACQLGRCVLLPLEPPRPRPPFPG